MDALQYTTIYNKIKQDYAQGKNCLEGTPNSVSKNVPEIILSDAQNLQHL